MWKRDSRTVNSILGFLVFLSLMLYGCYAPTVEVSPPPRSIPEREQAPPRAEETEKSIEPTPRTLASLRFTERARLFLEARKPDDAIRILERAVNLDPNNGQNYYFLAEAWLMKGVSGQAREFNRLAGIYLASENSSWRERVKTQREKIDETYKQHE